MYDPRETLFGTGPDDHQLGETVLILLDSQLTSPPLTPLISDSFEDGDDLSFPVYENLEQDDGDESSEDIESTELSPTPSMVLRPITQVLIERPEDDMAARMQPVRHVDYLSHEWSEEDLWSTWKHIVSGRSAYENSVRLENASWRSWEKTRRNLKTVSPGSVRWMKDHDVTWLYGPLQPGASLDGPSRSDNTRRRSRSSSIRQRKKPILKKRSLSELMLRKSISSASLLRQAATAARAHSNHNGVVSASDSFLFSTPALTPSSSFQSDINSPHPNSWKNVRFHELVEQCVAVGNPDDNESHSAKDSDDDVIVMRKTPRQIPKKWSVLTTKAPSTPSPKIIEKLPNAPLKSPEPPICQGLGLSYFPIQAVVPSPVQPTPVLFEDEDEADENDDWKPPTWLRKRKDSVHLLHDKLHAIKRSIGTSSASKPLHDSRLAITSQGKGNAAPGAALTTEGRKSPITFKLGAFSFTSLRDTSTPYLSSSSGDETPVIKSSWPKPADPAFTSSDYFSPRLSDTNNHGDDDEYDWIEACSPEDTVDIKAPSYNAPHSSRTSFPFPAQSLSINTLSPYNSPMPEKDPVARTSSDSGYGSDHPVTLRYALNDHASVRDTYNGTTEIEKERALCDWDLYPGAWDAVELEEEAAWSRGF